MEIFLPCESLQLYLGDPKVLWGHKEHIVPLASSESVLDTPPSGHEHRDALETS